MTGNCENCRYEETCKMAIGCMFGFCRTAYEPSDERLEELWSDFGDVPMDPETECMEAPFLHFPAGTHREIIWHWFDERYTGGVYSLLYPSAVK